ncbi:hypothetical protein WA026_011721 [Henosepilachna vigintioctopunctata]|uniref:Uncharacterized protein n=1 Tax=Henosepilachna vigintioctopunctata TaxID=420089 RepID=A0AAW1UCV2_9CUCU
MNYLSSKVFTTLLWVCLALILFVSKSLASPADRSPSLVSHRVAKRSFFDIQCKGVYDRSIFARLDRICEDCYNLFREPQVHSLCRKNCFTTDYFKDMDKTVTRGRGLGIAASQRESSKGVSIHCCYQKNYPNIPK